MVCCKNRLDALEGTRDVSWRTLVWDCLEMPVRNAMAFGSVNVHRQTAYLHHTVEAKTNEIGFEVDALYSCKTILRERPCKIFVVASPL